jgi:hypothetical protein
MKRENIITFVHDPARLDQSSLGELEALLDAYPWFQTAHLLVAKNHHNIDSIKFHEVLRETAVYAGDRTMLYHLINAPASGSGHSSMEVPGKASEDSLDRPVETVPPRRDAGSPDFDRGSAASAGAYQLGEDATPSETSPLESYTFTGWFDHFQSAQQKKPEKTRKEDLIDKFISESPVIPRGGDVPTIDGDVSESSAMESDSFMTETLARIYERQGLLKKAIYAYEKLSLKYPEKSTYFATQINRLKSQLGKN